MEYVIALHEEQTEHAVVPRVPRPEEKPVKINEPKLLARD